MWKLKNKTNKYNWTDSWIQRINVVTCLVMAMVFPVVMYGCESWTIKKAEHWRIDAFELWCWRRLLRVPWIARRSNQSILKEISPEYSLEGLMLKLKLRYFGHLIQRADSLEKPWCWERLRVGGEGDKMNRGQDGWMPSLTQWTWVWINSGSWWWTGRPGGAAVHGVAKSRTWLSDWTEPEGRELGRMCEIGEEDLEVQISSASEYWSHKAEMYSLGNIANDIVIAFYGDRG